LAENQDALWELLNNLRPESYANAVERNLQVGDAAEEIVRLAGKANCDLIVMGTHGRSGLGRLLMGSVAEKVLRKAPCPVVTVKQPFPQAETGAEPAAEMRVKVTAHCG
jgi:nucleotide-binding universal stress UspA family protein